MHVLIINTSEKTGGAAIAANRLLEALCDNGVKAKMLVRDKQTDSIKVAALPSTPLNKIRFAWERAVIWLHNRLSKENLWTVSIANTGTDITQLPEFKWADVIHLHWVNQGMLSLNDLKAIICSGKRVVWTLHDQWPYTGICHYAAECERFKEACHDCPQLKIGGKHDLSYRIFQKKMSIYQLVNHITFVGCSQWITRQAKESALLKGLRITHIPNTINHSIFHPSDKKEARRHFGLPENERLILFSSLKVTDKRKGIDYLVDACRLMKEDNLGIVVVGNRAQDMQGLFSYPLHSLDYIHGEHEMALLYTAVDAFVTPSLQDNLPNTIVEAMSVGTPCVGFNVGGIPEMIHHQEDGYVAEARNAEDLAQGISYVLNPQHHDRLSEAAAHYAARTYNPSHVVRQYLEAYHI